MLMQTVSVLLCMLEAVGWLEFQVETSLLPVLVVKVRFFSILSNT